VGFGFDRPTCTLSFSIMIVILEPPFRNTYSIKFFPAWTYITTIWWLMATKVTIDFGKVSFDGTMLKM
jgi:hypothetical protein